MATHFFVVLTRAQPGQEEAFHRWYDDQHLDDCLRLPEVRSARRFRIDRDAGAPAGSVPFDSLALYEIESDDPAAVVSRIGEIAGSEAMPLSEAFDRSATLRALSVAAGSRP